MQKILLAAVLVAGLVASALAQNLRFTPIVTPTQGGSSRVGNFQLDYTVGESVQKTLRNGNLVFTEGFEQNEKPLKPTVPASQTVCSDTAVTFVFTNRIAGHGADQVEWAYDSAFTYSTYCSTDNLLKIRVQPNERDTIWLRSGISGSKLVSDSIAYVVLTVNFKPQPPTPPAPVSVSSDTAYMFRFTNLRPGFGGNQLEWTLDSVFLTSWHMVCHDTTIAGKDTSDCTITLTLTPPNDTLFWIRCIDTVSGCISDSRNVIAILDSFSIEHVRYFDTVAYICKGTSFDLPVPYSEHTKRYYLRIDTTVVSSAYGNDSLLIISTGIIDSNSKFNVVAIDTATLSFQYVDTAIVVIVAEPVDTPVFVFGDTLVDKNDTSEMCYVALADNASIIKYSIVSGSATVDSGTGCLLSVANSFTIRATALGTTGCGALSTDLSVTVNSIGEPLQIAPLYKVMDTLGQTVTLTFDTIYAGANADSIEWSGNSSFSNATMLKSPAIISFNVNAPVDTVIWYRSANRKTGAKSKAKSVMAKVRSPLLSAGLLDKSNWVRDPLLSDEFNYVNPNNASWAVLPNGINGFRSKWTITGQEGNVAPLECLDYVFTGEPRNISVQDYASYKATPRVPDNYNDGVSGDAGEVYFKDGICHVTATRLDVPETISCIRGVDGVNVPYTWNIYYKTGSMATVREHDYSKPVIMEIRARFPVQTAYMPAYHIAYGTIWAHNINTMESMINNPGAQASQNIYRGAIDEYRTACLRVINNQTHCGNDEDWRTYTCMINNDEIIFFEDGKETYSMNRSDYFPATESAGNHDNLTFGILIIGDETGTDVNGLPTFTPGIDYEDFYDFQVDYTRTYYPSCTTCAPPVLQNRLSNGIPQTLENPNQHGQADNEEFVSSKRPKTGTDLSLVDVGANLKAYFTGEDNIGYVATKVPAGWRTSPLYEFVGPSGGIGFYMRDYGNIKGSIVPDNTNRVYFQSSGNRLKYFQKAGGNWIINQAKTNWNTFPVSNCAGNIKIDDQNRVWYKGTDNNIWCWSPFYNQANRITNSGDVQGSFVVAKCGCLAFYRDNHDFLNQLWWDNNGWHTIFGVVSSQIMTDVMALDEVNGRLYFVGKQDPLNIGKTGGVYYYSYDYSRRNLNTGTLVLLGYGASDEQNNASLCPQDYNALSNLTLTHTKQMLFYKSNDADFNALWYFFNDREPVVPGVANRPNWNITTLNYGNFIKGPIAMESANFGRLFYAKKDGSLYLSNWMNADNKIVCPSATDWSNGDGYSNNNGGSVYVYKTDSTSNSTTTEVIDSFKAKVENTVHLYVHPNPSNEMFNFSIDNVTNGSKGLIKISDVNSSIVYENKIDNVGLGKLELMWNASSVQKGVYFYLISINGFIFTGKIVKI